MSLKLAFETSKSLQLLNQKLQDLLEDTVKDYRAQNMQSAVKKTTEIIEAYQWMVEGLIELGPYRSKLNMDAQSWSYSNRQMTKAVKDLLYAFESKDHVLVADILEYDLQEVLVCWSKLLESASLSGNESDRRDELPGISSL